MATCRMAALMLLVGFAAALRAAPLLPAQVPEPLKPWVPWVLYEHPQMNCPFAFDRLDDRRCAWLTELSLDLGERSGHFESRVRVYADGWATLPGDETTWPQDVTLNGTPAIVTSNQETPRLWLQQGLHRVTGGFRWDRLPEALTVPRETGLLRVRIDGRESPFPAFNEQGQVWVRNGAARQDAVTSREDRLEVEVFRRVVDEIPLQLLTRVVLHVSGVPREMVLQGGLLPEFIPLRLTSPLPARVEPDGTLRLQLRPGDWDLEIAARYPSELEQLTLPALPDPWPAQELWTFDARNALRMVQVEGVSAVDPRQTSLPEDWKGLPAYRLAAQDRMTLRVLRRGDPEPEPDQLSLERALWLDFDGGGYSVSDTLTGRVTRNWRLDALPAMTLGRISVDGQPQSITRLEEGGPAGVEVRRGVLHLAADSRFEAGIARMPATGWAIDFHQVRTRLNLPPGWRLLAVSGVDDAPDTWAGRWTLLDLFVVLIATLAAARLWNWPTALAALLTLSLLWHEPGAPRYVWLSLLVAIALLRVLPEGRVATGVRVFRTVCWVLFLLIAIPFVYQQVRSGLYPQLDRPWLSPGADSAARGEQMEQPASAAPAPPVAMQMDYAQVGEEAKVAESPAGLSARRSKRFPDSVLNA
nr:hypothetical protein [Methylotetracoccus sp.]